MRGKIEVWIWINQSVSSVTMLTMGSLGSTKRLNVATMISLGVWWETTINQRRVKWKITQTKSKILQWCFILVAKILWSLVPLSSCSNHMTSNGSLLINIDRSVRCKVKMGTGDFVKSISRGTLIVETKIGYSLVVSWLSYLEIEIYIFPIGVE